VRRWVEHTGELEIEIEAASAEAVFAEAAAALAELLGDDDRPGEPAASRTVAVEARDRPALLAAFMEELVFLAESESLVPAEVRGIALEDRGARVDLAFARGDPPHLVKGVTYHRLEFEPAGGGYRARVVLDV
jgi:SHS2 domain-containing protein